MEDSPLISVITPIHNTNHRLSEIKKVVSSATHPTELIVVINNPELNEQVISQVSNELVVFAPRKGRGYAFLEGIANSNGTITMLLHSDTVPPLGWDNLIFNALKDPQVVGGGFSMMYANSNPYLEIGNLALNQWFRLSGELYGDRSIFVRSRFLRRCLSALEVPLFEDLRLVQCMHKNGRVVLLKEKVETTAGSLRKHGLMSFFGKFLLCRIWYALGGSPSQIYNVYYSTRKSNGLAHQTPSTSKLESGL